LIDGEMVHPSTTRLWHTSSISVRDVVPREWEVAMLLTNEPFRGTYRCPVCGRRDLAVFEDLEQRTVTSCRIGETPPDVAPRGPGSALIYSQVTELASRR